LIIRDQTSERKGKKGGEEKGGPGTYYQNPDRSIHAGRMHQGKKRGERFLSSPLFPRLSLPRPEGEREGKRRRASLFLRKANGAIGKKGGGGRGYVMPHLIGQRSTLLGKGWERALSTTGRLREGGEKKTLFSLLLTRVH